MKKRISAGASIAILIAALTVACSRETTTVQQTETTGTSAPSKQSITLYSGRNEKLIAPLIERFRSETGIEVKTRYADTAELAATLMEEGTRSPADVFLAQDAGALGAVSARGMFKPLPQELLDRVPSRFRSPGGEWVGVSGRARTVVYDASRTRPEQLPQSLTELENPKFRGRFGIAPTNASFQAHMAVYSITEGRDALRELLKRIAANQPKTYPRNGAIVDAVANGEIDFGLVNHYYTLQAKKERPQLTVANFHMPQGNASSFVNVAGAGILREGEAARRFVEYLLSDAGQRYFADETLEYPLVASVQPAAQVEPLDDVKSPDVDMKQVSAALEEALVAIQQSGLVK